MHGEDLAHPSCNERDSGKALVMAVGSRSKACQCLRNECDCARQEASRVAAIAVRSNLHDLSDQWLARMMHLLSLHCGHGPLEALSRSRILSARKFVEFEVDLR